MQFCAVAEWAFHIPIFQQIFLVFHLDHLLRWLHSPLVSENVGSTHSETQVEMNKEHIDTDSAVNIETCKWNTSHEIYLAY